MDPYQGCGADAEIGAEPLAVGWLRRNRPYEKGNVPPGFLTQLLAFCHEPWTVCARPVAERCPLCGEHVPPIMDGDLPVVLGAAEIRVIGETEIYAAPTLIVHYVTAHDYAPPREFITAVMAGPPAGSAAHRALVRALRSIVG
jgi:hypothetical protein